MKQTFYIDVVVFARAVLFRPENVFRACDVVAGIRSSQNSIYWDVSTAGASVLFWMQTAVVVFISIEAR